MDSFVTPPPKFNNSPLKNDAWLEDKPFLFGFRSILRGKRLNFQGVCLPVPMAFFRFDWNPGSCVTTATNNDVVQSQQTTIRKL